MSQARLAPLAREDIEGIWRHLKDYDMDVADRIVDSLIRDLELIARNNEMGMTRHDVAPGLRSMVLGDYMAFYVATEYGAEIRRVLHGSRDIERTLGTGD